MTDNAEISALGTLTVILDGEASVKFANVPEDYTDALLTKYQARGAGPFWIKQGGDRLLQFPANPPAGVHWEPNK